MNKKTLFFAGSVFLLMLSVEFFPFLTEDAVAIADKDDDRVHEVKKLELWTLKYDENRSYHLYWGLPIPEENRLELLAAEANATQAVTLVEKKDNSNVLCIADSCYRLLGIKKRANKFVAVLYNANLKEKIIEVNAGDFLEANISIKTVESLGVLFLDERSERRWRFDMFDVNSTKYKPKEIDEN